jgi:hypothetical protein
VSDETITPDSAEFEAWVREWMADFGRDYDHLVSRLDEIGERQEEIEEWGADVDKNVAWAFLFCGALVCGVGAALLLNLAVGVITIGAILLLIGAGLVYGGAA